MESTIMERRSPPMISLSTVSLPPSDMSVLESSSTDPTDNVSMTSSLKEDMSSDITRMEGASKKAVCPERWDVLCGRGGYSNNHPGNRLYRRLLDANKGTYATAALPMKKYLIAESVRVSLRRKGCRFLRQVRKNGDWEEIPNAVARSKILQGLREQPYMQPEVDVCISQQRQIGMKQSPRSQKQTRENRVQDSCDAHQKIWTRVFWMTEHAVDQTEPSLARELWDLSLL